ncbi:MAG: porin family protein [Rickettsiaceae bacterium]|nr:MAG: porin family protein [Rickettsiaceae bacterium]
MKKLLLTTAVALTFSSSALAGLGSNIFYAKFNLGVNKTNPIKQYEAKFNSNTASILMVGIGCNITSNIRTDLTYELLPNTILKASVVEEEETSSASESDVSTDSGSSRSRSRSSSKTNSVTKSVVDTKRRARISALMANVYVDMLNAEVVGVFVGTGIGTTKVKDSVNTTFSGQDIKYSKKVTNFAYHLTLGATAKVTDSIRAELAYSWRDYGKIAQFHKNTDAKDTNYRSHNLVAGMRFNI